MLSNQKEILNLIKDMNGVTEKLIQNQTIMANQIKILSAQIKILRGQELSTEEIEELDLKFK